MPGCNASVFLSHPGRPGDWNPRSTSGTAGPLLTLLWGSGARDLLNGPGKLGGRWPGVPPVQGLQEPLAWLSSPFQAAPLAKQPLVRILVSQALPRIGEGGWQSRVRGSGGLGSSGEACGHCPGLSGNWNLQADARWDEPDEVWGFGHSRLAVWLGTHGHPLWALVGPAESGADPKVQDPMVSLRGSQTPTLAT